MDKRRNGHHSKHLLKYSKIIKRNKVKPSKWKYRSPAWKKNPTPARYHGGYNQNFEIKDIDHDSEGSYSSEERPISPTMFKPNVQSTKLVRTDNLELPSTSNVHLVPYIASNKRRLVRAREEIDSSSSSEDSEDAYSETERFFKNSSRDQEEIQDAVKAQLIKERRNTGVFSDVFSIESEKETSSDSMDEEDSPITRTIHAPVEQQELKNESPHLTMPMKEKPQEAEVNNFFIFHDRNFTILVLEKNSKVAFTGMAMIKVLSGEAKVLGYTLTPKMSKYIPLYSIKLQAHLTIQSSSLETVPLNDKQIKENLIRKFHTEFSSEMISGSILHNVQQLTDQHSTVIVFKTVLSKGAVNYAMHMTNYQFSQNYVGESIKINNYIYEKLVTPVFSIVPTSDVKHIDMNEIENVLEEILSNIHYSNTHGSMPPRILLCGPKNTGKSTIIRYLINSVFLKCPTVMHLEADPGQSEFTPSGCISLCAVENPLLGTPFTHQKTPEAMVYVGGKSVLNNPDTYSTGIYDIMDHYKKTSPHLPLFINTMGWTSDMGRNLLVDVIRYSDPTYVIQLNLPHGEQENLPSMTPSHVNSITGWKTNIGEVSLGYELRILSTQFQQQTFKTPVNAKIFRDLATFAYWGRLQPKSCTEHFEALNSFKPFKVPYKKIGLYFCNDSPSQCHVLDAINVGLVALCRIDNSQMERDAQFPHFPKRINSIEGNIHMGYGIVRGINHKEETILLITPEPIKRLQGVNALVMGFEDFPIKLLSSQRANGAVPFMAKPSVIVKASLIKNTKRKKKRTDIHQQQWLPAIL